MEGTGLRASGEAAKTGSTTLRFLFRTRFGQVSARSASPVPRVPCGARAAQSLNRKRDICFARRLKPRYSEIGDAKAIS